MKKTAIALLAMTAAISCDETTENIKAPSTDFQAKTYQLLEIDTEVAYDEDAQFAWQVKSASGEIYSLAGANEKNPTFVAAKEGKYLLQLQVTSGDKTEVAEYPIRVDGDNNEFSQFVASVFDYEPAPGQFINTLPSASEGDSKEAVIKKVEDALVGDNTSAFVSLGGFGGNVVFGFDHPIINVDEVADFIVYGNAYEGSAEPAIIYVAYDKNGNGLPDDEWYEIYGESHLMETTIADYEITYYRPENETEEATDEYIAWKDNQGQSGYLAKNSFHRQSYLPLWDDKDEFTFRGRRLADNGVFENNRWVLSDVGCGYADNFSNSDKGANIDIAWARDKNGKVVDLPCINFVKVQAAVRQECGWIGEVSPEIAGGKDLHFVE